MEGVAPSFKTPSEEASPQETCSPTSFLSRAIHRMATALIPRRLINRQITQIVLPWAFFPLPQNMENEAPYLEKPIEVEQHSGVLQHGFALDQTQCLESQYVTFSSLQTPKGHSVRTLEIRQQTPTDKWIVFCLPNAMTLETMGFQLIDLAKKSGANVISYNYQGTYGSTKELPESIDDLADGGEAVLQFLTEQDITLHGLSLGGVVALELAARYQEGGKEVKVVVQNTLNHTEGMVHSEISNIPGKGLLKVFITILKIYYAARAFFNRICSPNETVNFSEESLLADRLSALIHFAGWGMNNAKNWKEIKGPKLCITTKNDDTIDFEKASLYKCLKKKHRKTQHLFLSEAATHSTMLSEESEAAAMKKFIDFVHQKDRA